MTHPTLRPGDRLGPYEIDAELGRGGAGVVVSARAVDPVPGPKHVAIKARLAADGPGSARFQREIGALRALRVPGTVRLHSAGHAGPIAWFSMDRVDGRDLRERAQACEDIAERGRLVARLAVTLLETLAGVHQRGFIHRDLKPGNVLVDGTDRVWLLDFGVARGWRSPTAALTRPGTVVGTLPYMAPEQVTGQTTGPEVDIFAAGLLLHEAIAGPRDPARVPQEWLARQCLERQVPLTICAPGTPAALSRLVDAMLSFAPEDRPTASEAAESLRSVGMESTPIALRPEPPRFVGRKSIIDAATKASRAPTPTLISIEGPAGSGRRRTIEEIRRRLLLRGVVGQRIVVRAHAPGSALGELLARLVENHPPSLADGALMATVWPDLPDAPPPVVRAERKAIAEAASRVIEAASQTTPLVLEIRDAQDMDGLLADTLRELARRSPPDLLILLSVDDRWQRSSWQRLQQRVSAPALERHRLPDLDESETTRIARSLGATEAARPGSPLGAAEAAWDALARRDGTHRTTLPWAVLPLALVEVPIPDASVRRLGVVPEALAEQGLLDGSSEAGWTLRDRAVQTLALAGIADRAAAAERLLDTLADASPELRARMHTLTGGDALDAAVLAAEHALDDNRAREARAWMMLADTLPRPDAPPSRAGAFRRAAARAGISLGTDRGPARDDLVAQAERRADTAIAQLEAALLRAELRWRSGERAEGRTEFDAVVGEASRLSPSLAALARERRARLELEAGQPAAALRACTRARTSGVPPSPRLAELEQRAALWTGEPARALVPPTQPALETRAQLLIGRPSAARKALDPAWGRLIGSGPAARFEARLLLARLELLDGRSAVAMRLLDELQLPIDAPAWLPADRDTVGLLLALARADISAGDRLAEAPPTCLTPDWGPMAVRWWRLRGAASRGQPAVEAVAARLPGAWGQAVADEMRAWLELSAGRPEPAARAAERARDGAARAGMPGVARQARMLLAAARAESDAAWSYLSARGARGRDPIAHLDALELDALRRQRRHDREGAIKAWTRLARIAAPAGWRMRTHHARRQLDQLQRGDDATTLPSTLNLDGE